MKYVVLVLVVGLVLLWTLGRGRRSSGSGDGHGRRATKSTMVQCAHCGVHLPQEDAVQDGRLHYCSQAHRLAGPARKD